MLRIRVKEYHYRSTVHVHHHDLKVQCLFFFFFFFSRHIHVSYVGPVTDGGRMWYRCQHRESCAAASPTAPCAGRRPAAAGTSRGAGPCGPAPSRPSAGCSSPRQSTNDSAGLCPPSMSAVHHQQSTVSHPSGGGPFSNM